MLHDTPCGLQKDVVSRFKLLKSLKRGDLLSAREASGET